MSTLKEFALMLVFLSAVGLVYYFLLPSGKVSETAKSVFSVVFLLAALGPLFTLTTGSLPQLPTAGEADTDAYNSVFTEAAKTELSRQIGEIVKRYTDVPFEISVSAYIGADRSIEIEQVNILFDADVQNIDALTEALREALGFTPKLEKRDAE